MSNDDKAQEVRVAFAKIDGPEGAPLVRDHTNTRTVWDYLEDVSRRGRKQRE